MQAFSGNKQPGACTRCAGRFSTCRTGGAYAANVPPAHWLNAAALTRLRREKTDVHGPGHPLLPFGQFTLRRQFFPIAFYSGILPELCEAFMECSASQIESKHTGDPSPVCFSYAQRKSTNRHPPSTPFPKILIFFVDNPKHIQYNEITVEPFPSGAFSWVLRNSHG